MFKPTASDPGLVNLSALVYRLLLAFYPTHFRHEYGPHMVQVFRDCCLKTYRQSGTYGMFCLWSLTLFDWFKTVIEESLQRETTMSHKKFIRLSGWGMMLGAVTMAFAFLVNDAEVIRGWMYLWLGPPITGEAYNIYRTVSEQIGNWLLLAATLLITTGVGGLRLRYGKPAGALGNNSLLGSLTGGVTIFFASLFNFLIEGDGWWYLMVLGMFFLFGGLVVFGVASLQSKPMLRWNGLPIFAGIWIPLFLGISFGIDIATPGDYWWNPSEIVTNGMMILTIISLVLLGYLLQGDILSEDLQE